MNKDEYKIWLAEWRDEYTIVSGRIRILRESSKSRAFHDIRPYLQSQMNTLSKQAREMMENREQLKMEYNSINS